MSLNFLLITSLPQIQILLSKHMLQIMMVSKYLTLNTIEVMPPDIKSKHYRCQLQIMHLIIPLMLFRLT